MENTIFRFILRYSKYEQILLLLVTLVSFPFLYIVLDLPKEIINEAIGGTNFPRVYPGVQLTRIEYLLTLCFLFLALILLNGGLKFWINVYRGRLGEQLLRRLRYTLFSRVLRFPHGHFNKTSQGEIVSMITSEVEPLGGFVGIAFSMPLFQAGTLLTILTFIMIQDWILGIAAIFFYPFQIYLIPKLQRKINVLGRRRIETVRKLSERIGETVSGIDEVHGHDTSELERARIARDLGAIYRIRYEIYIRKFFVKFLNNFIAQVTPFLFYSIGGYFVIKGSLSFGSLVAVLAAYRDLTPPWKELLTYYQRLSDARIKYDQLIAKFRPADLLDESHQQNPPAKINPWSGSIEASNLTRMNEVGMPLIDGVNFRLALDTTTAVVGPAGSGSEALTRIIAGLLEPTGGRITLNGIPLTRLHAAELGSRRAYVDQNAYVFSGTIRDNLVYGLKHKPLDTPGTDFGNLEARRHFREAQAAGNTTSDLEGRWIDYDLAGVATAAQLDERLLEVLSIVDLQLDDFQPGPIDLDKLQSGSGLDFSVGIGGGRLSSVQRQKICLARALLKRPDFTALHTPASTLDPEAQKSLVKNVLAELDGRGVIWVLTRPELAPLFQNALVLENGKIMESGPVAELNRPGYLFYQYCNPS